MNWMFKPICTYIYTQKFKAIFMNQNCYKTLILYYIILFFEM